MFQKKGRILDSYEYFGNLGGIIPASLRTFLTTFPQSLQAKFNRLKLDNDALFQDIFYLIFASRPHIRRYTV